MNPLVNVRRPERVRGSERSYQNTAGGLLREDRLRRTNHTPGTTPAVFHKPYLSSVTFCVCVKSRPVTRTI